jgi:hypothetical protein
MRAMVGHGARVASRKTASKAHLDEPGVDDLYAVPLADFIAARNELAASLRAEHDKPGAARVKALRKPSAAAWVVNQLARRHPRQIEALIAAGERVRAAQGGRGKGGSSLREASEQQRAQIAELMQAASEVLTDAGIRGQSGPLEGVRETLQALATASDEQLALLRRGVLTETLQPADISDVFKRLSMSGGRARPAALASDEDSDSEVEEDETADSDDEDVEDDADDEGDEDDERDEDHDDEEPASEGTNRKVGKRTAKKTASKRTAKKTAKKPGAALQTAAKKAAAKKAAAEKAATKKTRAKKAIKKTAAKKTAAKQTAAKQRAREAARERLERQAERARRADAKRARDEASREAKAEARQAERAAAAAQRAEERAQRAEDAASTYREQAIAAERAARLARARAAEAGRRLAAAEAELELA